MSHESPRKTKTTSSIEKAKELVRKVLTEDFRQKVSQKTINEIAAKIVRSLPKIAA
jgi:hypothetical protein